ncbi:zinc finger, CCHC-type containing protein [Tanacetum coccineum]
MYGHYDYGSQHTVGGSLSQPNPFGSSSQPNPFGFSSQPNVGGSSSQPNVGGSSSPVRHFSLDDDDDFTQMYSQFSESFPEKQSPVEEMEEIQVPVTQKKLNRRRQTTPKKKPQKEKAEDQRCVPWTPEEETALCKGWVRISEDSIKGNARKERGFWVDILNRAGDSDYLQKAMTDYHVEYTVPFTLLRCWEYKVVFGGGMERGFLSEKGSGRGRGVKEKRANTVGIGLFTASDGTLNEVTPVSAVKEGVAPSVVDMTVEMKKLSSLEDTTVLGSFPPLSTPVTTSAGNAPGKSSYVNVTGEPSEKKLNIHTLFTPGGRGNGIDVVVPVESIRAISERFANTAYSFFLGKRVAYPVVANYVRNTWGKYGLVRSMFSSSTDLFSFRFSFMKGLNAMLENGPWFIQNHPLILKKWHPDENLLKEDVSTILVWVKLHGVPVTAFSEDGLSAIATKLGTPLMLDSYTSDMCIQSWGRSSYARVMIELRADVELKDNIIVAMPKIIREGHYICNVRVEYEWKPPRCETCKIFGHIHEECLKNTCVSEKKTLKKPIQTSRGVPVGPKMGPKPQKEYRPVPKKSTASSSGTNGWTTNLVNNEATSSGSSFMNVDNSSTRTTLIIDKIGKFKELLTSGKATLVDEAGNPLKKVEFSDDYDSEDEVASVDNDMARSMASERVGFGTQSLLEQWRDSYGNGDYDEDPYDDDMYEDKKRELELKAAELEIRRMENRQRDEEGETQILPPLPFSSAATFANIMCCLPLPPPLSPPSAKLMTMALEGYGYQSRKGYEYQRNGGLLIPMNIVTFASARPIPILRHDYFCMIARERGGRKKDKKSVARSNNGIRVASTANESVDGLGSFPSLSDAFDDEKLLKPSRLTRVEPSPIEEVAGIDLGIGHFEVPNSCVGWVEVVARSSGEVNKDSFVSPKECEIDQATYVTCEFFDAVMNEVMSQCGNRIDANDTVNVAKEVNNEACNRKVNFRSFDTGKPKNERDEVQISLSLILEVHSRFEFSLYGYFMGKRVGFPVVENYVRNAWKKYGIVHLVTNSKGFFFFKFSSVDDMNGVLEWTMNIRYVLVILKKWMPKQIF